MLFRSVITALLHHEKKLTLWSNNSWKIQILNTMIKLALSFNYTINCDDKYNLAFSIIMGILFLLETILHFFSPLYWKYFYDFFNLWFSLFGFILECMIFLDSLDYSIRIVNYYQYSIIAGIYCAILCAIKYTIQRDQIVRTVTSEKNAICYLRMLFRTYLNNSSKNKKILLSALLAHEEGCVNSNCSCKSLIEFGIRNINNLKKTRLNKKAYETKDDLSEEYINEWKIKVIKLLESQISLKTEMSSILSFAFGEISFYCEGNIYKALHYLETIDNEKQSLIYNQLVFNFKNNIERGMWSYHQGKLKITTSLMFQIKYDEFTKHVEDVYKTTLIFWKILVSNELSLENVTKWGKKLCSTRRSFMELSKEINKTNSNHLEFLVRFGLFTKFIIHDKFLSNLIVRKILYI